MARTPGRAAVESLLQHPDAPLSLLTWATALPEEQREDYVDILLMHPRLPADLFDRVPTPETVGDQVHAAQFVRAVRAGTPVAAAYALYAGETNSDDRVSYDEQAFAQVVATALLESPGVAGTDVADALAVVDNPDWWAGCTQACAATTSWPAYLRWLTRWDAAIATGAPAAATWGDWWLDHELGACFRADPDPVIALIETLTSARMYLSFLRVLSTTGLSLMRRDLYSAGLVERVIVPAVNDAAPICGAGPHVTLLDYSRHLRAADWQTVLDAATSSTSSRAEVADVIQLARTRLRELAYDPAARTPLKDLAKKDWDHDPGPWLAAHVPDRPAADWSAFIAVLDAMDPNMLLADAVSAFASVTA